MTRASFNMPTGRRCGEGAQSIAAVRAEHRRPATTGLAVALLVCFSAVPTLAQDRDPMLFYDQDGLTVRGHLQFG